MQKTIRLLSITLIALTGCRNYTEVDGDKLKFAFIINSSPTFKGYYYQGSDNNYHYFESKWDFEKDKLFKISINKLTIQNKYVFKLGDKEFRVDLFDNDNNEFFGQNEFCKLYIYKPSE